MAKIIGIIVVFACVLGGFILSGGQFMALVHPYEILIIGGAALGAFLQANPGSAFMHVFSKYPGILKDQQMTSFICDYLRIMSSGNMAPHELEGLFDMEISSLKEEIEHPAHAVAKVADGMPAMGIVAAVLGIVITMSILAEADNAEIGQKVGTALVGTFFGILASYGFFGPLAAALEHDAKEELNVYEAIKAGLVASASGMPPSLAVEFSRKVLFPAHRPSFSELEQAMRGG